MIKITEDELKKLLQDLAGKFDAIDERLKLLETPSKEDVKDDPVPDPMLTKATEALRHLLKNDVAEEKLKSYDLNDLIALARIKEDFQPEVGIIPPTGGLQHQHQDAYDEPIPDQMKAHFSETGRMI